LGSHIDGKLCHQNLALIADPFDTSDPFENQRGTPSIENAVAKGSDKIHIRESRSDLASGHPPTPGPSRQPSLGSGHRLYLAGSDHDTSLPDMRNVLLSVTADELTPGLQQRNGRKTLTTVQGLPDKYDPKKLLKAMKKEFACNGTVVSSADSDDEEAADKPKANDFGKVLQFQGDQRMKVKEFLVVSGLVSEKEAKDTIVV